MFDEYMYILLRTQTSFNYKAHYLGSLFGNDFANKNKDYAVLHLSNLVNDGYVEKTTVPAKIGPNNIILKKTYSTLKFNDKFFELDLETLHRKTFTFDINSLSKTELKRVKKKIELGLTSPTIVGRTGAYYKFDKSNLKNPNAVVISEYYLNNIYDTVFDLKDDEQFKFNLIINDIEIEECNPKLEHIFIQNSLCRYFTTMVENSVINGSDLDTALIFSRAKFRLMFLQTTSVTSVKSSSLIRLIYRLHSIVPKSKYTELSHYISSLHNAQLKINNLTNDLNSIEWVIDDVIHKTTFGPQHINALFEVALSVNRFYPFSHTNEINSCGKIIRHACKDLPGDIDSFIVYYFNKIKKNPIFKELRRLMVDSSNVIDLTTTHKTINNKDITVPVSKSYIMKRNILRKQENALVFRIHKEIISTYIDVTLLTDDGSESDNEFNLHLKSESEFNLVLKLFNDLNKKE